MILTALIRIWARCFGLACLFAGPALFLIGTGFAVHEWNFIRHAVRTEGTVTNLVAVQDEQDHSTTYRPIFSFQTSDGVTHTIESSAGSNPPGFEVGQHVTVLLNPTNPNDASINSFWQLWLFAFVFGVIGICALISGLFGRWLLARLTQQRLRTGLKMDLATIFRQQPAH